MKKTHNAKLTKEMLEDMGIYDIYFDEENQEGWIDRYWFRKHTGVKVHTRIKVTYAVCKHKYTEDIKYLKVNFNYNGKAVCLSLSRLLYAWFKGDVPEGMVVDHIDNNHFNNSLDNLQLLTQKENLRKRSIDNNLYSRNQGDAIRFNNLKEAERKYKEALYEFRKYLRGENNEN